MTSRRRTLSASRLALTAIAVTLMGAALAPSVALGRDGVAICHATGSPTNPYNLITVSAKALDAHRSHAGDIVPAPPTGCPRARPT